MRSILAAVRNAMREPAADVDVVHFHQGPGGMPSPCYDDRCRNPRLHVDWRR
jgi:hypothetical protein